MLYILDEKGALVPLDVSNQEDVLRWGLWMEDRERCIVKRSHGNGLFISTVFLGLRSASIATRARPRDCSRHCWRRVSYFFLLRSVPSRASLARGRKAIAPPADGSISCASGH